MQITYFELNNWMSGEDYPAREPFLTWMWDYHPIFLDERYVKKQKLCVLACVIDQSTNYCITAPTSWVEAHCPTLLDEDANFLRFPDKHGSVYGNFGHEFLPYSEENIGITWLPDE